MSPQARGAETDTACAVALIPARGGSKGIPHKNVAPLGGRPLIAYTIEAALRARSVGRTVVSTDDAGIARLSRELGAEVPFLRPSDLAQDETSMVEVVKHFLERLAAVEGLRPEVIVLLQPTSPLRTAADIDRAVELFRGGAWDSVVSVVRVKRHPLWMFAMEGGRLVPLAEAGREATRRQDLPLVWRLNGAIYVTRPATISAYDNLLGEKVGAYEMPDERSLDIDSPLDLLFAETWLKASSKGGRQGAV